MNIGAIRIASPVVVFLLICSSTLGAGIFTLPVVLDGLDTRSSLAIVVTIGMLATATLAMFGHVLSGCLDQADDDDFIVAVTSKYLGARVASWTHLFMIATLGVYLFGFAHFSSSFIGGLVGVDPLVIGAAIAGVVVAQQRKRTSGSNLTTAVVLASVNLCALVGVFALALPNVVADRLFIGDALFASTATFRLGALAALGSVVSLFYGHPGVANAVKEASRWSDPRQAIVRGTLAAGATLTTLFCIMILVGRGAADPALVAGESTVIQGLMAGSGPALRVLATTYLVGQSVLAVLQSSMTAVHLTREMTGAGVGATAPSVLLIMAGSLGASMGTGGIVFALETTGALFIPLLGGTIPAVLFLMTRSDTLGRRWAPVIIALGTVPALLHAVSWSSPLAKFFAVATILVSASLPGEITRLGRARTMAERQPPAIVRL